MQRLVASCTEMPDPSSSGEVWMNHILEQGAWWRHAVAMPHFADSVCDVPSSEKLEASSVALTHVCGDCGKAFATAKALSLHQRKMHGVTAPQVE